ncbi:O-antigen ligase family protein [Thiopseudomonas denitrificans]|uniref:O-antigen ligase-related domain-containing protein n=1 Tax=Thiopseudomonas denitrificans TaxID=1501432 RepID=A0A4R6TZQ7_9GAMM|nr:O-antigen ligase family protein [Thiopseudomonas denitrificans]TDQ37559.1 hypothetical protein DFQ45_10764 [Thiopseudomonas denitrificans]
MQRLGILLAVLLGVLLGGLALAVSPGKWWLVCSAVVVSVLVMLQPLRGFLLFVFCAAFIPYTTVNLGVRTTVSEALLLLTWAGVAWQMFTGHMQRSGVWHPAERSMVLLLFYSLIPLVAGVFLISVSGSALSNWVRWAMNMSVFFLVPLLLAGERERELVVQAFLAGSLAMLFLSVGYFLKDRDANTFIPVLTSLKYAHPEAVKDIFSANYTRMASPWVHPNLTGGILALTIPVAFMYGWTRTGWARWLGMTVAILGCAGLLFSISRGAIVALALVLFWLAHKRVPLSLRLIIYAAVLGTALIAFYPPLQERLLTMFLTSNASTTIRFEEYRLFPQAMAAYPLGIGFAVDPPVPGSGLLGISNLWLNVIYKIGVPGLLIFAVLTLRWWRAVRPLGAVPVLNRENALWLGALSGVLAALLTGLFDHYYSFTNVIIALFWLFAAMALQTATPDNRQGQVVEKNS